VAARIELARRDDFVTDPTYAQRTLDQFDHPRL
jgi:hypothetical protein